MLRALNQTVRVPVPHDGESHRNSATPGQRLRTLRSARQDTRPNTSRSTGCAALTQRTLSIGKNPQMVRERRGYADVACTVHVYGHV